MPLRFAKIGSVIKEQLMKKTVLLIAAVLFCTADGATAQEEPELGVTFELSYWSKWLSKGAEAYGQKGAFFETLDLDFYDTGFGAKVTHRNAIGSGYVDSQRFDYRPYYKSVLFEAQPHQMNYNISAGYEHYPGLARERSNTTWEWIFAFSWPNLMPKGLVPSYIAHYEYAAGSGYTKPSGADMPSGWVHRFILGCDLDVQPLPEPLHISSEVAYTDGLGGAAHDWSYATFGLSTNFHIDENLSFRPGLYQQISMEDTVAKRKDITYCILTMKYEF